MNLDHAAGSLTGPMRTALALADQGRLDPTKLWPATRAALHRHGYVEPIPGSHRYRTTATGHTVLHHPLPHVPRLLARRHPGHRGEDEGYTPETYRAMTDEPEAINTEDLSPEWGRAAGDRHADAGDRHVRANRLRRAA